MQEHKKGYLDDIPTTKQYFIMTKQDLTCPNKLFQIHLVHQLKQWHLGGDRLVLFMDHNEHTYDGLLGKVLSDPDGLGLQKVVLKYTGKRTGSTFFQGSKPINGLWVTSNIEIVNTCLMPFGYGIGNHRMFVLDITLESLVGRNPTKVVRPASCRLNSKVPRCREAYVQSLERNIVQHRLLERLNKVHHSNIPWEKEAERLNAIDHEGQDYIIHAEKICRKIKNCRIPYSPEASIWIQRAQVYHAIIQWHKGKIWNKGNLKQAARWCNIQNPLAMSLAEVLQRVEECKQECKFFQENRKQFQAKHLNEQM
jgi:hypothetical protein